MNTPAIVEEVAEARDLVREPAPADFYRLGLAGCIDRLTVPLRRQGTCVHWETPHHSLEISASCASLLYRSAQVTLNNALRHAHATDVTVRLSAVFHGIRLTVADNGTGMRQGALPHGSARHQAAGSASAGSTPLHAASPEDGRRSPGLRTMSVQVEEAGGTVAIASDPGAGTAVTVTIPLD
ncbi:MAG: histidine kinase [Arthrobacter sp.]|nr:histidine kinase [Arthrobacter sp.]